MLSERVCVGRGRLRWLVLAGALAASGCNGSSDGTQMTASFELEDNECGDGALDVEDELDLDVTVAIDEDSKDIEWTSAETGEYLAGAVSGDSFVITSSDSVDQGDGCVIEVTHRYSGTFELENGSASDLQGTLTIEYEAASEEDCAGWIGSSTGFRELPCDVVYSFDLDVDD